MLIGINGPAGAGKDTLANFLVENHGFKRYAFADALRDAALALNPYVDLNSDGDPIRLTGFIREPSDWNWAKREIPEIRRILQVLGTEVGRNILGENCWVDILKNKWVGEGKPDAVITDFRFPNEEAFIRQYFGITVRIERPDNPDAIAATHASEQFVPSTHFLLVNDSGLDKVETAAFELVKLAKSMEAIRRAT